jgi:hypothetical protein
MGCHVIHVDDIKGLSRSRKSKMDSKYKEQGQTEKIIKYKIIHRKP